MRFKFWPSTLRVQLILVVAGAVALSNIAVAIYFYKNSEAQTRNINNERMTDRTAVVAATLGKIPPNSALWSCSRWAERNGASAKPRATSRRR